MARPPTPWFQFFAKDWLTDPKVTMLSHEEKGILIDLWSWMWTNDVRRGTLLLAPKTPIPDEGIARFLEINSEKFLKISEKFLKIKILKRGSNKELYSKRMRKFKTPYELYKKEKHTKNNNKTTIKHKKDTLEREVEVEREVKSKESNPPSATSTSPSVEKSNTNPKKSWREIQDRKIEKTQKEWVEIFNQKISAGQLQLLVYGSKKHRVDGFKSYEALWVWMRDCKSPGQKPEGDAFLYAKALAKDWGGVKGYSQRAWGRMKDAQVIADVFDEIKIRYGKT